MKKLKDLLAASAVRIAFGLFLSMMLCALPLLAIASAAAWIYEKCSKIS